MPFSWARGLFRSPLPSSLRTPTSARRFTPNFAMSIQAESISWGQWNDDPQSPYDNSLPTSLAIITWNVDFARPDADRRLTAALDHLQFFVFPGHSRSKPPHCVILLQEISINAFDTLLAHPWVREWFRVVPASAEDGWPRGVTYGTVTLVHAPLAYSACVLFESRMGRNALVTDISVGGDRGEHGGRILRVINTHLESLPQGTPLRVVQMGMIAGMLKEVGGIACGDMNAIAPSDATLPEQNGLSDAWELRRDDEDEEGTTWGYQPRTRFPPGRLDKILYTEGDGFSIKDVRRVAVGLKMPGGGWVSDHYGLACLVEVKQGAGR